MQPVPKMKIFCNIYLQLKSKTNFSKDIFVLVTIVGLLAVSAVVLSETSWDDRLNNLVLDAMSEGSGLFAGNLFKVN